ncbi:MAG: hypothetical protein GF307_05270 [candidate division Zixibacteria bacterium]|nr:hypothetical protein [candidate division Zixibacteria bacterium]
MITAGSFLNNEEFTDRYGLVLIVLIGILLSVINIIRIPYCVEDAYITFRYSGRFAEGNGLTYNDGEKVLGTTTPLYALLLGILGWITSPASIPMISRILGVIGFLSSALLIYFIIKRLTSSPAAAFIGGLVYAAYPPSVASATGGMEVAFFQVFLLLSLFFMLKGRPLAAGILCGIVIGLRPDGLIWAGCLGVITLPNPRQMLKFIAGNLTILLPLIIGLAIYYGNPLPHSITAKRISYGPNYSFDYDNLINVLRIFLPVPLWNFHALIIIIWFLVFASVVLSVRKALKESDYGIFPFALFAVLYPSFLFYGRTLMFQWYGFIMLPMIVIVLLYAAHSLRDNFKNHWIERHKFSLITAGLTLFIIIGFWRVTFHTSDSGFTGLVDLEERGMYFRDNLPEDASIMLEPLGIIGYECGRNLICEIGLVSPEVTRIKRQYGENLGNDSGWYFEALRELKPDYLLLRAPNFYYNQLYPYDTEFFRNEQDSIEFYGSYRRITIPDSLWKEKYPGIQRHWFYLFERKPSRPDTVG